MPRTRAAALEEAHVALRRVALAMRGRLRDALREHGLTFPQWVVLKSLRRRGRMTARELADALEVTPANVTGILDRLERDGLAVRSRAEEDRRVVYVRLTERGHERVDRVVGLAPQVLADMFEGWTTEDLLEFKAMLGRLRLRPEETQELD